MHPCCSNTHAFNHLRLAAQDNLVIPYCRTKKFRLLRSGSLELTSTDSSWPVAITDAVLCSTKISHVLWSTMIHSHSASVTVYVVKFSVRQCSDIQNSDEVLFNQGMAFVCTYEIYKTLYCMQIAVIVTLNALYSQNLISVVCAWIPMLGMYRSYKQR